MAEATWATRERASSASISTHCRAALRSAKDRPDTPGGANAPATGSAGTACRNASQAVDSRKSSSRSWIAAASSARSSRDLRRAKERSRSW
ncbi:hypothetical protein [Streptomyces sp. NPDC051662]|uniref:hypothetical protein n=1 Tax=Streptomyces sp. NPDC051662 TaxID=3154750 RepID=UPI00342761AE